MTAELLVDIGMAVTVFGLMGYLAITLTVTRLKNKRLYIKATQAEVDRLAVYVQAQEIMKREADSIENSDGFVKFVSKSRDWAFEYIETVQKDLFDLKQLFDDIGVAPKTVAQANDLHARISKVLNNLPEDNQNV